MLQMQDEIVTHLARALDAQLTEAEAARLKRTPVANPDAEDLALQCEGALWKGAIGAWRKKHAAKGNTSTSKGLALT